MGGLTAAARVTVFVADVNDNRPTFYPTLYTVSLSSHSARAPPSSRRDLSVALAARQGNTVVSMVISAEDGGGLAAPAHARVNVSVVAGSVAPPGVSKDVLYSISSGDPEGYFTVDGGSGTVRTARPLDHEARAGLEVEVQARHGSPPAYASSRVRITISDVNDNAPVFLPSSSESLLLPEVTKMGAVVYRVRATDRDSGHNGQLSFDLVSSGTGGGGGERTFGVDRGSGEVRLIGGLSGDPEGYFTVDGGSGTVRTARPLDHEARAGLEVEVQARHGSPPAYKDGGAPQLSATFTLVVHVQAQDAHGPSFDTLTYRVELRENAPLHTRFLQVRALHREATGSSSSSSSSSSSEAARQQPRAHHHLRCQRQRARLPALLLRVPAAARGHQDGRRGVPRAGHRPRSGHNGQLSFDLVSSGTGGGGGERTFGVGPRQRRGAPDRRPVYESVPRYDLQVVAKDGGAPQLSATFTLVVHVQAQGRAWPQLRHADVPRGAAGERCRCTRASCRCARSTARPPELLFVFLLIVF
ncbi:hypothetical protein CRUP_028134 [Coryphaenoides rupestris]|nr:hypothetical protein CRUP_028134 [Coryphaenoides rupestris]